MGRPPNVADKNPLVKKYVNAVLRGQKEQAACRITKIIKKIGRPTGNNRKKSLCQI
jgi:hypothetical protein